MTTSRHTSIILGALLNMSRKEVNCLSSCLQLEMKHFLLATRNLILYVVCPILIDPATRYRIKIKMKYRLQQQKWENKSLGVIIHR